MFKTNKKAIEIIDKILDFEGEKFVNSHGEISKYGISLKFYQSQYPESTIQNIENLTKNEARALYFTLFQSSNIHFLPEPYQPIVFDTIVNSGQQRAYKILQKTANLPCFNSGIPLIEDGILGEKTINEILSIYEDFGVKFINKYCDVRIEFLQNLVNVKTEKMIFLNGWINRINSYRID